MNEKRYRMVVLGKPNEDQATKLHIKRYIKRVPRAGAIVPFDRSRYNRAVVEPVMGFSYHASIFGGIKDDNKERQ